jgi:asparagine synthase (glutamine-hydrolysing)
MCGIAGYLGGLGYHEKNAHIALLRRMGDRLKNRGPDSAGVWVDQTVAVGLCHRRLSIVDLSDAGSQPMESRSGRYVIVFNGEIYNHRILREELESSIGAGIVYWNGSSDTETILAAIEEWGLEVTLKRSQGMFAIALWDKHTNTLFLARDRFGEKPIYYGWQKATGHKYFVFASDLGAIKVHPSFENKLDHDSLGQFLRYDCIGGEKSIYAGIHKLLPGHLISIKYEDKSVKVVDWWKCLEKIGEKSSQRVRFSAYETVDLLEKLLLDVIGDQMLGDVPIGAFLSGGVDSSIVVALMQKKVGRPINTFTIGFESKRYNEGLYAKRISDIIGTNHQSMTATHGDILDLIPNIPNIYTEPFADSSQLPTYLVSKLARQSVKVALSGDGADELFGGYNRYKMSLKIWPLIFRIPPKIRRVISSGVLSVAPSKWNSLEALSPYAYLGEKAHKAAKLILKQNGFEFYSEVTSRWGDLNSIIIGREDGDSTKSTWVAKNLRLSEVEMMMVEDLIGYLPDDILTKVDRAAMAVGLETRVPFLDHRVVEFAWSLPLEHKLREGVAKWPLRQILKRYVPENLVERPKMGFCVPIDEWLRGPLKVWASDLLSESRIRSEGLLNPDPIAKKWKEHISGSRNWQYHLWNVLMFEAWLSANRA